MSTPPIFIPGQAPAPTGLENTYRWATVTDTAPLRVRLDGDSEGLPVTPDSLVAPGGLTIGDRVWVQLFGRRLIVIGKGGGAGSSGSGPKGLIAWWEKTSNITGGTATTSSPISGTTLDLVAEAGRRYRVAYNGHFVSSVSNDRVSVIVERDGSPRFTGSKNVLLPDSSFEQPVSAWFIEEGLAAGTYTYQLAYDREAGSGTISLYASSNTRFLFSIEDLGETP